MDNRQKEISNYTQEEIDNDDKMSILISQGWKRVKADSHRQYRMNDWLNKYAEGKWVYFNNYYLFENEKDATVFGLRWADK